MAKFNFFLTFEVAIFFLTCQIQFWKVLVKRRVSRYFVFSFESRLKNTEVEISICATSFVEGTFTFSAESPLSDRDLVQRRRAGPATRRHDTLC